jgi:glyoxylase-like metal-dependent hydrolase (beta-lactamase superfamily II)/predicted esterase
LDNKLNVTKISDDIWEFTESNQMGPYVDSYLIIGDGKALLFDCLQTVDNLYEEIRKITDLPVDVLITHGHGDHAGKALKGLHDAGCIIYMDIRDYDTLTGFGSKEIRRDWFCDCHEGMVFDIGRYCFRTISVPGHTVGSLVFLDEKNRIMFSGDTIGSGHFWMQIPSATSLRMFSMGLEKLYGIAGKIKGLKIYPGHRNQSPVQLDENYIRDCRTVTNGIINGTMKGEHTSLDMPGRHMEYEHLGYGMMVDFCYDKDKINSESPDSAIEKLKDRFEEKSFTSGINTIKYEFFKPVVEKDRKYPLVVYLHGAGERGDVLRIVLANSGATSFASEEWQKDNPCFIMAPQCPSDMTFTDEFLKTMVSSFRPLSAEFPIDTNRIYITGLSMGGFGTWRAITMFPTVFAAAMPICGGGDPLEVRKAKNVPVWAFHAEDDPVVPVSGKLDAMNGPFGNMYGTRTLVSSLRTAGAADIKYTEYPAGYMNDTKHLHPHCSWVPAYENTEAKKWMFANSRFDKYDIELLKPGVWHIEDFNTDSWYIVEGSDKALIIDTGLGGGSIRQVAETLTDKPLELAITHAHPDHMMHADEFETYYMSHKEASIMEAFKSTMPGKDFDISKSTDIKTGDIIDLGGGVKIEVFEVAGHTPGSVVFFDRAHKFCFTGDILGVWMQVPCATTLSEYKKALEAFSAKLNEPGYDDLGFLAGHYRQEGGIYPFTYDFRVIGKERVDDLIKLCDMILGDEVIPVPYMFSFDEPALSAEYKTATIIYKKSVKK